ncbi:hypothetical protein GCM10010345_05040 [Streptomyces canarius]|uniref:DUF3553 domain-containing protein n=1 Tax=Streptomyces canarius TaxID=285453 RepID=A0ABQ3CD09_9ACTN|nr:hypothetical protein GCM10010345_05040 [Streptomyces canarius]
MPTPRRPAADGTSSSAISARRTRPRAGNCDTCEEGAGAQADRGASGDQRSAHPCAATFPTGTEVRHEKWGGGTVLSEEPDRITVLFDRAGYHTLSLEAVADHDDLLTVLRRPGEEQQDT